MTDKLPPNLLALFTARPPLRWVQHCDTEPSQRKTPAITAVAPALAQAKEVNEKYKHLEHPPTESWLEKRDRVKLEKEEKLQHLHTDGRDECMSSHFTITAAQHRAQANSHAITVKPNDDPNIKGDPLRTLFVGRLSYEATEDDLRKAFGQFGRIQSVTLTHDQH
jgi:U1 small nuclear ribonucleoprotein